MNEDFWDDLLGAYSASRFSGAGCRARPDAWSMLTAAEQTFTSLIGQRLAERLSPERVAGVATTGEAVALFLRERGRDEVDRLYRVIYDIINEVDPAPGDALRDLAAIDDLRLFVRRRRTGCSRRRSTRSVSRGGRRRVSCRFRRISRPVSSRKNAPSGCDEPIPSFSICLVKPSPRRNTRSTMRTGWSGCTRCSATRRVFPTGFLIR